MSSSSRDTRPQQGERMSLTLHFHPLSSFCWKVLIALYENDTPFEPRLVDLGHETERAALLKLWPIGKFPVLSDDAKDRTIPESSIIIEYLDNHYPGRTRFIPADPKLALQTRLRDRFYDLYVHLSVQKIVGDRLRPEGKKDPHGVEEAKARIQSCYGMIDKEAAAKTWPMGEAFSLADCAASPALFYASKVMPFGDTHKNVTAYFDRLKARPSFARVIKEAEPYFAMFPQET
jgi:glutathione S-transferase